VLTQDVPAKTADDVVEVLYLQNTTDQACKATVRARYSTTVDEASGAAAHHGPRGTEVELAPGELARIGDVLGWEWDSSRWLTITFRQAADSEPRELSYELGVRGKRFDVAGLGDVYEVPPFAL
jgi:hypothetical protein